MKHGSPGRRAIGILVAGIFLFLYAPIVAVVLLSFGDSVSVISPADLLTTELASNAVDHSITPFEVTVVIGDEVRVEVVDGSVTVPVRSAATPDAERGRGLLVVDALASEWAVEPSAGGKTVWFTVPARPRSQVG